MKTLFVAVAAFSCDSILAKSGGIRIPRSGQQVNIYKNVGTVNNINNTTVTQNINNTMIKNILTNNTVNTSGGAISLANVSNSNANSVMARIRNQVQTSTRRV